MTEGKLIDIALHVIQGPVEIGPCVVPLFVDEENQATIVATLDVHGFAPGERSSDTQAAGKRAIQLHLQSVVAGRKPLEILGGVGGRRTVGLALGASADNF